MKSNVIRKAMRRLIRFFFLTAAVAAALSACTRDRVIPDAELALIFRDAYLINAYVADRGLDTDSLELYEPVFARYGYTAEDVRRTVGNFSRRKSAKLSDVVERSIALLEAESARYKYEVGVLDTIDQVARRRFTRTVYSDSLVRVRRLEDTARLRIRIPDVRPGEYRISYGYRIDSLDRNANLRMRAWFERSDGSRSSESYSGLVKRRRENISRTMRADTSARALVFTLYGSRDALVRPDVTVYDLQVVHVPEPADALDSLFFDQLDLRIFADEFFPLFASDSLALPLHGNDAR